MPKFHSRSGKFSPNTPLTPHDLLRIGQKSAKGHIIPPPEGQRPRGTQRGTWRLRHAAFNGLRPPKDIIWLLYLNKTIPTGYHVSTTCHVPGCYAPSHLQLTPIRQGLAEYILTEDKRMITREDYIAKLFEIALTEGEKTLDCRSVKSAQAVRAQMNRWRAATRASGHLPPEYEDILISIQEEPPGLLLSIGAKEYAALFERNDLEPPADETSADEEALSLLLR